MGILQGLLRYIEVLEGVYVCIYIYIYMYPYTPHIHMYVHVIAASGIGGPFQGSRPEPLQQQRSKQNRQRESRTWHM